MKKLYILGSGFTKAFSKKSPTLQEILLNIKTPIIKKKIEEYGKIDITSPEDITSLILDNLYDFDPQDILNKKLLSHQLLSEIANNFITLKADEPDYFSELIKAKFISTNEDEIYVATFNYDTLIEDYSKHVNYLVPISNNPYEDEQWSVVYASYDRPVKILKLHGSVNWFSNNLINVNLNDTYFVHKDDKSRNYIIKNNIPVLVPFIFNKSHFMNGDLFTTIWRKMDLLLNEADEISFIGYGFPKTDFQIYPKLLTFAEKIRKVIVFEDNGRLYKLFKNKIEIGDARQVFV